MFGDEAAYVTRVEDAVLCSELHYTTRHPDDDPYGSKHVGVKCAIKVTACDNILIIYVSE